MILRKIKRYIRDKKASMTVELAIILPVFLFTVIGILETGMLFFTSSSLENAVLHSSRFGILGKENATQTRQEIILDIIEQQTFGRVDMKNVTLTTLVYENFSDINKEEPYEDSNGDGMYTTGETYSDLNNNGQWDEDLGQFGLGEAGDIVLYKINYSYSSLTGFMDPLFENLTLSAAVAVRNEPY